MRAAGVELLPIPENCYDDLEARLPLDSELSERLLALNILYDEDEHGRYFQVYTRVFADRFFFEIVAREGYLGFGAQNAPIRLCRPGPAVPDRWRSGALNRLGSMAEAGARPRDQPLASAAARRQRCACRAAM